MTGDPPVFLGSDQAKYAESWRMLMICGGAGASGTSVKTNKTLF